MVYLRICFINCINDFYALTTIIVKSALTASYLFCPQAAILQQTADYIFHLEREAKDLRTENQQLKKFINQPESTDGKGRLSQ